MYQRRIIKHVKIINDITDPAERETALEKEKAEWITTQREQSVLKLQNLADEESAQYTLKQQMALEEDSYQKTLEEIERISEKIPTLSGDARIEAEKDLEAEKQKAWGFQQNLGELQQTINDIDLAKIERIGTVITFAQIANNQEQIANIYNQIAEKTVPLPEKMINKE